MRNLLLTLFVASCAAAGVAAGTGVNYIVDGDYGLGIFDVTIGIVALVSAQIANAKTKSFKHFGDKEG
jgi:hypothetical protein